MRPANESGRPTGGANGRVSEEALARTIGTAMNLAARGAYDQAIRAVEAGGRAIAAHPLTRNMLGNIYLQQGRPREALRAFEAAAKAAPRFPEAHCNRGVVLERLGRHDEALAAYLRALALRADYPLAQFNRANLLRAMDQHDVAIAAYDAAIASQPNFPESLLGRGLSLLATNRPIDALTDFDRASAQRPGYREARLGKARALLILHRAGEALAVADGMLRNDSADVDALSLRADALEALERFADVLVVVAEVLRRDPLHAAAHARRSNALRKLRRYSEALAAAEEAVRLAPESSEARYALALALGDAGRFEEALNELDHARDLGAPLVKIYSHQAVTLVRLGRFAEATVALERALGEDPADPGLRTNYAYVLLRSGDLERGFAEHEHRLRKPDYEKRHLAELAPQWKGEDIRGKRLLVYQEQGLGDAIQFVRYVKLLARREVEISLLVSNNALLPLLKPSFPSVDVTDVLGMRGAFDRQVSLMSLSHVFGSRLDTIPGEVPYLEADPNRIERWREGLAGSGIRVGLCWQGDPNHERDRIRSLPLAAFAPMSAVAGVRLLSLQAVHGLDQLDHLPAGMRVESLGLDNAAADGLAEAAAIIMNLDLVVTADTAIAHLAGALAVPVWTAIRFESEWRWLLERGDTPWYPTMRLFRQTRMADWTDVVGRMTDELAKLAADRGR
jgi:tetratricopeptide (TPR) repeat protein